MAMLTFVDLFCGGGFGARGAVRGGGRPLLAVDVWELATQTYKANFPEAEVITDRIENLNPYELARKYKPGILLTSPECTSHSIARGARPACENSRATAMGIIDWAQAMKPEWLIVENVSRMKQWKRHGELKAEIEGAGYRVNELLLNAADFGSPQARKRMFLVCSREGHVVEKEDLLTYKRKTLTAADIIDWSEKYSSRPLYKEGRAQATLDRAERAMRALGRNKPFLIVYYGSDYAGGWQGVDVPLRTITTLDRFGLVTWQDGQPFLRMLQPEELKLGMGAGTSHKLPFGSRRDKVKLCGNGVCSDVLAVIFKHLASINTNKKSKKVA